MAMQVGSARGPKSEINVTPLVDVVLVLLIIFMVVTPMLQRGKDVHLPKARQIDEDKRTDALVLSMTKDRRTWLDTEELVESELLGRLQREIARDPTRKVLVKADEELVVGDVRRVMDVARRAGAKGVSLGVEELKQ
jgi:biopolymer transport protein ExbD